VPQKNVVKQYQNHAYYHAYNHFVDGLELFSEEKYCQKMLQLFDRYLSSSVHKDSTGMAYSKLVDKVDVVAYCLMPTHYHLLVYQKADRGITELVHRIGTSLGRYANANISGRRGTIFETAFKAVPVSDDSYLWHISRYIHLNPLDRNLNYADYAWSSYQDYISSTTRHDWLKKEHVMRLFSSSKRDYAQFVADGIVMHLSRK